jgi:hypothetical protein
MAKKSTVNEVDDEGFDIGEEFDRDESDEQFDREFEEAFQAHSGKPGKASYLIAFIFMGVAAILLVIAVWSAITTSNTIAREVDTPGRIVDLVEEKYINDETGETNWSSYPVVEFFSNGGLVRVQLNMGSWPPSHRAGDEVIILYVPGRPENARIQSTSSDVLMWLVPALTGFVGTIFIIVALSLYKSIQR